MTGLSWISLVMLPTLFLSNADGMLIDTIPATPQNDIAIGYSGLKVYARYTINTSLNHPCSWRYGKQVHRYYFSQCQFFSTEHLRITCDETRLNNSFSDFVTNFTFLSSLAEGKLNLSLFCLPLSYFSMKLPLKTVKSCPKNLGNNVLISASSSTYGDRGNFYCQYGAKLFDLTKNALASNLTTCLVTAEWERQNQVDCWRVPTNVKLTGINRTFYQGTKLILSCSYDSVYPTGNETIFYIGAKKFVLARNTNLVIKLEASDNNKLAYCQAGTPYTQVLKEKGRSSKHQINVLFPPFSDVTSPTICNWIDGMSGSCSIRFKSNPTTDNVTLVKIGFPGFSYIQETSSLEISGDLHTFTFRRTQVNAADYGNYSLIVYSRRFRGSLNIPFTIEVSTNLIPIIVASAGVGGVILIVVILSAVICSCRKKESSKKDQSSKKNTTKAEKVDYYNVENHHSISKNETANQPSSKKQDEYLTPVSTHSDWNKTEETNARDKDIEEPREYEYIDANKKMTLPRFPFYDVTPELHARNVNDEHNEEADYYSENNSTFSDGDFYYDDIEAAYDAPYEPYTNLPLGGIHKNVP